MTQGKGRLFRICGLLLAAVVALCCARCSSRRQDTVDPDKAKRTSIESAKQRIEALAAKHKARVDWAAVVPSRKEFSHAVALEIQEGLEPLMGQPLVLLATIVDVYRTQDRYRVICNASDVHLMDDELCAWGQVYLLLDLPKEKAKELVGVRDKGFRDKWDWPWCCGIVFQPERFRIRFAHGLSGRNEDPGAPEDVTIVPTELERVVWIEGKALDFEFLYWPR